MPIVDLAGPSLETDLDICAGADDPHLARCVEPVRDAAHLSALLVPVEEARAVEEVLEGAQ